MSLALTTIILIILVFPITVARRAYSSAELSFKFTKIGIVDEILNSVFTSLIFHLITIKLVTKFGYHINYEFLKSILFPNSTSQPDLSVLYFSFYQIIGYFFLLFLLSFSFFFFTRNIIRYFKIDRKLDYFRYENFWYYLLTGEILHIKEYNNDNVNIDLTTVLRYVDVLTKIDEGNVIYSGFLVEYQLAENDSLEFIVLSNPTKQTINSNEKVTISSKYFIIPYKEILNFNITYKEIVIDNEKNEE